METLPAGVRFGGDYEILRVLGAGGMATVYEAREEPIGRVVALKVLDRAEPALRARFLAEARTMAGLRHPGVAEILRFGTDAATGLPFLAMKPYPGSLADRLGDSRALAEADAAALGLRLADALAALHAADPPVVHRDVKPSNVLLDETGAPVLADFGVAKRLAPEETLHTLSSAGTQPGTWSYAAPEQRTGLPLSPAADWYAFGVLLYRCLTGGFPPPGGALHWYHLEMENAKRGPRHAPRRPRCHPRRPAPHPALLPPPRPPAPVPLDDPPRRRRASRLRCVARRGRGREAGRGARGDREGGACEIERSPPVGVFGRVNHSER